MSLKSMKEKHKAKLVKVRRALRDLEKDEQEDNLYVRHVKLFNPCPEGMRHLREQYGKAAVLQIEWLGALLPELAWLCEQGGDLDSLDLSDYIYNQLADLSHRVQEKLDKMGGIRGVMLKLLQNEEEFLVRTIRRD